MRKVQAPRITKMCLPMLGSRMRNAAQDKVRLTFGVPKLNMHHNLFTIFFPATCVQCMHGTADFRIGAIAGRRSY